VAGEITITLNYPTSADNRPRWGYERPAHPILAEILGRNRRSYEATLDAFLGFADAYRAIDLKEDPGHPEQPFLLNPWLPGLDSLALYSMVAMHRPAVYLEVGSGNSTKFTRRSIRDHGLSTQLVSIDPQPRAEVDALCDQVIREPVESVDLAQFEALHEGDILFIDNSHRCFMNSDVTVVFIDILPRLRPGVLVHIHDIFLPQDYPPHWAGRYYSEQYLLAAYLLAEGTRFEVLLPNAYISGDAELRGRIAPVFAGLEGVARGGGSFWLRTN
jgi:hypothetical protein